MICIKVQTFLSIFLNEPPTTAIYTLSLHDALPIFAKFYRPGRWSDAAIEEEHAYTRELAEREIPVVAPLSLQDRKSTRLNSSHMSISYAVFCLKKKKNTATTGTNSVI